MSALSTWQPADASDLSLALEPWDLRGLRLRNRIFMSAHGTNYQIGGAPTQRYVDYLAERAKGGAGLIITEGAHVHPTSGGPAMIDLWRESSRAGLEALAAGVHEHGGAVFCQLLHNGRQTEPVMLGRAVVGPSAIRDPAHSTIPHALTRAEIAELVRCFADSAQMVRETGFDGLELHAAHGYLIEQFMSPFMNQRSDEYGGSHANRLRFARDVVRALLDRVGDEIVVGARLTAYETVPGGLEREEALQFTQELAAEGLHFVSVTLGQHASPMMVVPPAGVPTLPMADELARVREELQCAVFASHRVRRITDAEGILRAGLADMVNMSRGHLADPEIVNKARAGRVDETRPCIGCVQGCRGQLLNGLPIGCLVNPRGGRESVHILTRSEIRQRVAVVGGGIAGMQYASTAASRGHDVTLFERSAQLGGAFRLASTLPTREEFAGFTDVLERELEVNGVAVRKEHEATPGELGTFDQVVVAVGGVRPAVATTSIGDGLVPALGFEDALAEGVSPGSNVVIVDRGDQHNLAILLARQYVEQGAASVAILDPSGAAARRLDLLNRWYLTRDFAEHGVRVASNVSMVELVGKHLTFESDGWPQEVDGIDHAVVIEGLLPVDQTPWTELESVTFLGDCDAPGLAVEIVHQAYAAALEL